MDIDTNTKTFCNALIESSISVCCDCIKEADTKPVSLRFYDISIHCRNMANALGGCIRCYLEDKTIDATTCINAFKRTKKQLEKMDAEIVDYYHSGRDVTEAMCVAFEDAALRYMRMCSTLNDLMI